jgi:hypothetical protein
MKLLRKTLLALLLLISCARVSAVFVRNMPVSIALPDKTELQCFVTGDEYVRTVHDEAGYTLVQHTDGFYYYALLQSDSLIASAYKAGIGR